MNDKRKIELNVLTSLILILISSILLLIFSLLAQGSFFLEDARLFITPNMLLINLVPILLLHLFLYFASSSIAVSTVINCFIFVILSLVNRYKIVLRQDPLMPSDITLFKEAFNIVSSIEKEVLILPLSIFIVLIIISILAIKFIKNKKINLKLRLILSLVVLLFAIILNKMIYSSETIFNKFEISGHPYFEVNSYKSKGLVYNFIYDINSKKIEKPDGYNREEMDKVLNGNKNNVDLVDKKPNVIIIMGEAFSDISENINFDFTNYKDPLENYKKIKEDSLAGTLYVPRIGGGTADTEFDVLTAITSLHYNGVPYSYRMINKETSSLASIFKDLSYETLAIHPGAPWFYNRQNVYPYLGFDNFIDETSFDEKGKINGYMSEELTMDRMMKEIEEKDDEKPLFMFTVTIQNHGLYYDRYGADTEKNFDTDAKITKKVENEFRNYFHGLYDVDRELKRFYDFLDEQDEEYIVLYFGDHLPGFSAEAYDTFPFVESEEKFAEENFKSQVPYFIWANQKAKSYTENKEAIAEISSNFLGVYLLEILSFEKVNPFFEKANAVMQKIPVISNGRYLIDKKVTENLSSDEKALLDEYKRFEYYVIE